LRDVTWRQDHSQDLLMHVGSPTVNGGDLSSVV
jgi:hypothetical protein